MNTNRLIGYQIESKDGKHDVPSCFASFEIFEDSYVAEKWLQMEKNRPEHGEI